MHGGNSTDSKSILTLRTRPLNARKREIAGVSVSSRVRHSLPKCVG